MELVKPFEKEEIKATIFSIHPNKSLGPDGMNLTFYQKFWDLVGRDVTEACLHYLNNLIMPIGLNDTWIVLVPKTKKLDRITDTRPIALYNVLYKIMAKAIANRLKWFLSFVIFDNQNAFVAKRSILDNVMVAFETGHYLKRKLKTSMEQLH